MCVKQKVITSLRTAGNQQIPGRSRPNNITREVHPCITAESPHLAIPKWKSPNMMQPAQHGCVSGNAISVNAGAGLKFISMFKYNAELLSKKLERAKMFIYTCLF
jgi:hypothetical protein